MRATRSVALFRQGCRSDLVSQIQFGKRVPSALQRNRCASPCAPHLRADCNLHISICSLRIASRSTASVLGRHDTPAIRRPAAQPIQLAQLPGNPFTPAQTVPAPMPSRPPLSSFRKIQVFPRSEGIGPIGRIHHHARRRKSHCHQRRRERRRPRPLRRQTPHHARSARRRRHRNRSRRHLGSRYQQRPRRHDSIGRQPARNLHGRQHRLPPRRSHRVRRSHVLRRSPPDRPHDQRRIDRARASKSTT